jgi:ABC-2 type transport system permease protein
VVAYVALLYLRSTAGLPTWLLDAALFGAVGFLALVRAFATAYRMLVERRDASLIATAPVDLSVVLRARAIALAMSSIMLPLFWFSPIATMRVLLGESSALFFYPATLAIGMTAAAAALAVLLAVSRFAGKARMQAMARLAMLVILLAFVASRFLDADTQVALEQYWMPRLVPVFNWMGAVVAGQAGPMLAMVGVGCSAFLLAPTLLARGFARSLSPERKRSRAAGSLSFSMPLKTSWRDSRALRLMGKEWRLLWRDRSFLAQTFFSLLVTIAAMALVLKRQHMGAGAIAAAAMVYAAGNLCSDLTWLSVSGEQAPSLLRTAPMRASALAAHKLLAAVLPVAALLLVAALGLAFSDPLAAVQALVFGALAGAGAAAINLAWPTPGERAAAVFERRSRNRALGALDAGCLICWAMATATPWSHPGVKAALAAVPVLVLGTLLLASGRFGRLLAAD